MKILVHMNQLLYPPDTGGKIRSSKLFEKLAQRHEITIVCFRRTSETDEQAQQMHACCSRLETVEWSETAKFSPRFYAELAANLLSPYPYIIAKYYDRRMEARIRDLIRGGEFDLLLCDFLQPSLNVLRVPFRPRILFQHNVESVIRRRHYRQTSSLLKKGYLYLQWCKLFRFERRAARAFDHCIMVSERDKEAMQELYGAMNTSVIPTGVDVDYFRPAEGGVEDENGLVFTGSMDWLPNEDAMQWFAGEVLPRIRSEVPVKFSIVGRNPSAAVQRLAREHEGIEVTGTVDDVRPYIDRAKVYVVPLRIGGGTRIKIFEAMAMGKAVVSTTVGAEGLPVSDGKDIVLADDAEAFARRVVELIKDNSARRRLGEAAARLVRENYTWDAAARVFGEICERVAAGRKPELSDG